MGSPLQCRVYVDASLALAFGNFVSYSIFDPSSPLTPKYTIAFLVNNNHNEGPFTEPQIQNQLSLNPKLKRMMTRSG